MELKKSNRVSWATGPNLCQVKHFLQEDCPSKVGRGSQHHLQLKPSLRPSFEGRHCLKQPKERLPYIPLAKWKCPPKFNLNERWCMVAGEESKEAEAQKHREKRVLEAVYPSRSAIPPNPSTSSYLDQFYDDNQTRVIPIIPIEETAVAEGLSHSTPSQNISSKLLDPCLPNSSSSSISIDTTQKLPASGKSFPQALSTSKDLRLPQSNSPFCVRLPVNGQSAPYLSRCRSVNRTEQHQISPKPPANHNPVTQFPSTFENPKIPQHQAEVLPKSLANHNPATQCHSTYENLNTAQCKNQISPKPPANVICVPQYQSNTENLSAPQCKTQACSNPPANEKSILEKMPHGFEGDLMVAVTAAVAALAKSQEQGSLIDTDFLIKLLSNPEQIQKLMNEHGVATNPETGAASGSKPIVPSSSTPRSADSLDKQIAGNENCKSAVAGATVFSRSLEVRNINEQRGTAAMSRSVDLLVPLPRTKPDKVINKPISEYQAPHAGSGPIFGPKAMAKSVPLAISKPETSVKSNLVNEQRASAHVGTADIRESKPLVHPTSDLNLEKIKKLINEYGAPDNIGEKPLVNSELVPSLVSSTANFPIALQPELQIKSYSSNAGHTSPFSSMTSPAPLQKDINYYKSLIKQHGENRESVGQEILQNIIPYGNTRGPEPLKNLKSKQDSLNFQKHCVFFNTPRGCLNGTTCPFLHDMSKQWRSGGMLEAPAPKRMKLGGELTGRT
ncbi:PREDICTED: zinc finger CCCH domain-containing protein 45-like [Nicotiana attenuata]|uniref:Zinc finger ccch domain-containing protein 6 n=1 Tax=Nicotiana attenuata TaxID=49451 RepID=A0A314L7Y8_NICAT|nr:PREDICTED: zinc finger CCCH domain-containing protein 45-like [Nicotiana attenuata]OIT37750.1 zinc finger ccch domain-containing protein 6 [Nicotiana attenuata]